MDLCKKVKDYLSQVSEDGYKEFNDSLIKTKMPTFGVRIPILRDVAKKIAKYNYSEYLDNCSFETYDEICIYGYTIGYAKMDNPTRTHYLDIFISKIDNWSTCDTACNTYKFMKKENDFWWQYLLEQITVNKEFYIRFSLICMLSHFVDDKHIDEILKITDSINNDSYYVNMAIAWLVCECIIKFRDKGIKYIENDKLNDFTHNKAIQKSRESFRVSKEDKEYLNSLKRK